MSRYHAADVSEERAGFARVVDLIGSVLIILVPLTACSASSEEDVRIITGGLHAFTLQTTASTADRMSVPS